MKQTVFSILDGITRISHDQDIDTPCEVSGVYKHVKDVSFPDEVVGSKYLVHKDLEKKNYIPLKKDDPLFISLGSETIKYDREEHFCPIFVNEAVYYDKNIAFSLAKKETILL